MNEKDLNTLTKQKHQQFLRKPMLYWDHVLGAGYWSKQKEIVEAIMKYKRVAIKSCHGIGKTYTTSRAGITFNQLHKDSKVITTAPTFRQVEKVMWTEWRAAINKAPVKIGGNLLKVRHDMDDEWFAMGISSDKDDGFQGIHSPYMLVLVDEASGVEDPILNACDALCTAKHNHLVYIGNPTNPNGRFCAAFKSKLFHKISISCFDTPNFTYHGIKNVKDLLEYTHEELEDLDLPYPELITPAWVWERAESWGEDSPIFKARCLAEFPEEGEDTLIGLHYTEMALEKRFSDEDAKERKYIWTESRCIGIDVARFGDDMTVITAGRQNTLGEIEQLKTVWHNGKDTMKTVGRAVALFNELGFDKKRDKFIVDDTGVGGGVTDRLIELGYWVVPINSGEGTDDERFTIVKGEMFWHLRDVFREGKIKILDTGRTASEIPCVKYDFTSNGLIYIIPKDKMKKLGFKSPDFVDALALMCFGFTDIQIVTKCVSGDEDDDDDDDDEDDYQETIVGNIMNQKF